MLATSKHGSVPPSMLFDGVPSSPTSTSYVQAPKFPHTKAMLGVIWREYKPQPLDTVAVLEAAAAENASSANATKGGVLDPALVNKATLLLEEEKEDELKALLKSDFGAPDDVSKELRALNLELVLFFACRMKCSTNMFLT